MPKKTARRPRTVLAPDPLVSRMAEMIAHLLREALADGKPLLPLLDSLREEVPIMVVAAATPGLRRMVELAIRGALETLEAEAAARAPKTRPSRRRSKPTA